MKQLGIKWGKDKTSCLPTERLLSGTTKPLLHLMVLELKKQAEEASQVKDRAENLEKSLTSVIDSMESRDVTPQSTSANINTSARNASNMDMEKWTAKSMRECEDLGQRPCYLRHNVFCDDALSSCSCAEWTEIAHPLVSVPPNELNNPSIKTTIENNQELFEVSTPINVDNFERLLVCHPNPPFVKSVIDGL